MSEIEPRLYLISRPTLADGVTEFLSDEQLSWVKTDKPTPAEQLIEFAGRVCYLSFGAQQFRKRNSAYIENLIRQGHESVLEHASWTFLLAGVSRAFTHQLVRHRVGFSFSQLSQQYHDESQAIFVRPHGIERSEVALRAWDAAIDAARQAYGVIQSELLKNRNQTKEMSRAIRSAARSILPNATETKIVVTANGRSIRDFINVRGSIEGDYEMRAVSFLIYELMRVEAPSLVADFVCTKLGDGTPSVAKRQTSTPSL